jgi:hypothetical protein
LLRLDGNSEGLSDALRTVLWIRLYGKFFALDNAICDDFDSDRYTLHSTIRDDSTGIAMDFVMHFAWF